MYDIPCCRLEATLTTRAEEPPPRPPPGQEEGEAPEEEGQEDTEAGPEPASAVASDAELILQPLVDNGTENIVTF